MTKQQVLALERRRKKIKMIIGSSVFFVAGLILALIWWGPQLAFMLYGWGMSLPSEAEIKAFQAPKVAQARHSAQQELASSYASFQPVVKLAGSTDAVSLVDACTVSGVGPAPSANYRKVCILRKGVIVTSSQTAQRLIKSIKAEVAKGGEELAVTEIAPRCWRGIVLPGDRRGNSGIEMTGGHSASQACRGYVHQAPRISESLRTITHDYSRFDTQELVRQQEERGEPTFLFIAFQKEYFSEIMKGSAR